MVVDTHCHLDLTAERGVEIADALQRAHERDVTDIVQIAVDLQAAERGRRTVDEFRERADVPRLHWTAGIHPEGARPDTDLQLLSDYVRAHRNEPAFVAIGETGLDYFHTRDFVEAQRRSLEAHFSLAAELALPVVLHLRDAQMYDGRRDAVDDALALLDAFPGVVGVLHCFTYTHEEALPFVERGWFVSYSGILTFRNAKAIQEGARHIPLDRLLVETDAPFLAPAPNRGKTNEPAFVADTLEFLVALRADARREEPAAVREAIYQNSRRFLDWKHRGQAA